MEVLVLAVCLSAPPAMPAADARVTRLETEMMQVKQRLAALESAPKGVAQNATCPCGPNCPCVANQQAATASAATTMVCGPGGCSVVPAASVQSFSQPMQFSQPMMFMGEGGGSCANGSCSSGNSGRRGLFGRRR